LMFVVDVNGCIWFRLRAEAECVHDKRGWGKEKRNPA
jgi:hypothetical protein